MSVYMGVQKGVISGIPDKDSSKPLDSSLGSF